MEEKSQLFISPDYTTTKCGTDFGIHEKNYAKWHFTLRRRTKN